MNTKMKAGTKVKMTGCLEAETYKDRVWVTQGEPWQLGSGEWVVSEGMRARGFALKNLVEA